MKAGSKRALLALAHIFEEGNGVQQDFGEAMELYTQVEEEEPVAAFQMGKIYEEGNDPEGDGEPNMKMAVKYFEMANKLGSKDARTKLAQLYISGVPDLLDQNPDIAYKLLVSIEEPNADALNTLGSLCYSRSNFKEAFKHFKTAVSQGNVSAMNNLGTCYEFGHGCDKDIFSAFDHYQQAAVKGNV